jgi:hypothetical protein
LKDPFVHARNAGLMALSATAEYYEPEEMTTKVIPAISHLLIDKEKFSPTLTVLIIELSESKLPKQWIHF